MENDTAVTHKFQEDSHMTFQDVFDFAYQDLIPVLQGLARELGEEHFWEVLKKMVYEVAWQAGQETARQLPCNDFAAFNASLREDTPLNDRKHWGRAGPIGLC